MRGLRNLGIHTLAVSAVLCTMSVGTAAADVKWNHDVPSAAARARTTGRPMLLQFTADWCGYCKKMKATTFADASVEKKIAEGFVPVMVDADKHSNLVRKLGLKGLPATVIVAPDLRILKKLNGYQTADKLIVHLDALAPRTGKVRIASEPPATKPTPAKKTSVLPATSPKSEPRTTTTSGATPPPVVVATRTTKRPAPAFGGACLVTLLDSRKLTSGNPAITVQHRGFTICFAGEKQREAFRQNPNHYWPQHDGACVVSAKHGRPARGLARYGVRYQDRTWMFSSLETMKQFVANPSAYIAKAPARSR